MFNIQPGQGTGFTGSKQIALGLGGDGVILPTPEVPGEYPGGGGRVWPGIPGRDIQEQILREDMDIIALVVAAIESGIIE